MSGHRVKAEAREWGNVPPYPSRTMYRGVCQACGWTGAWWHYPENVPKVCPRARAEVRAK